METVNEVTEKFIKQFGYNTKDCCGEESIEILCDASHIEELVKEVTDKLKKLL